MIALEPAIVEQLRSALPEWDVMGLASDNGKRDGRQLVSVSLADGQVPDSARAAVQVQMAWSVILTTAKGPGAAQQLDDGFAAAVRALHGWSPGKTGARGWERMQLTQARPSDANYNPSLTGLELVFTTAARFDGHPDSF